MGNISKTRIPARLEMSDTSKVQAAAPSIVDPDENPEAVVFNNLLGSDVSATVSGASVASFAGDVSDNDKGAVNLSMLFAWRAVLASGPTGFSKEAASNTYRDALITLGWPIPPMTISKVSNKDLQGRCDKVVLGLMQGFMDASTLKHFSHVFESIGNDSDKGAGSVFNSGVKNGPGSGSFSTGSVIMDSGLVKIVFGMYSIQTSVSIDQVLWFEFRDENATVDVAYAEAILTKSAWGQLCARVWERLGPVKATT